MVDDSAGEVADRKVMVIQPAESDTNKLSVCIRGRGVKSGRECRGGSRRRTKDTRPEENGKDDYKDQDHNESEEQA